jgi:hypothetical protein
MRTLDRLVLWLGLFAALSVLGCKQGEGGSAAPGGGAGGGAGGGDSLFGAFDPAAEVKALQGAWKVKDSAFASEPSLWTIQGDKLSIQTGDKKKEGQLEVTMPGELAFVQQEGGGTSREYFAYARDGEAVYIGLGVAGVKAGERLMLRDDGLVAFQGGACKFHAKQMFGGWETPVDVKCALEGDLFKYEVPDRFKKGELKQGSAKLVGNLLLNDQMQGHKAEKAQP